MSKTTALILTLVAVLLCGCPGLASCFIFAYSFTVTPEQAIQSTGMLPPAGSTPADLNLSMWIARLVFIGVAVVLVAIPVVVFFVTRRSANRAA